VSFSYFGVHISIYYIDREMDTRAFFLCSKYEPFIELEPMTYALPWCYSTTELKGPPHHILMSEPDLRYMDNKLDTYDPSIFIDIKLRTFISSS
jgi:hypothetical protein